MGSNYTGILENLAGTTKRGLSLLQNIYVSLKKDNISTIVKLDTSITSLTEIRLDTLMGGTVRSLTVLDIGGGIYLQTSLGDPFIVHNGDFIENEEIELLRWYGSGAGTAIIRVTGVRL